jgi:hypothetical protein
MLKIYNYYEDGYRAGEKERETKRQTKRERWDELKFWCDRVDGESYAKLK